MSRHRRLTAVLLIAATLATLLLSAPATATTSVVGTGTPESRTESALVDAIQRASVVTFNCGTDAATIALTNVLEISRSVTLDGGGLVTLDGPNNNIAIKVNRLRSLTLRRLTVADSTARAVQLEDASLVLDHATIRNTDGIAIYGSRSLIDIVDSTIEGNLTGGISSSDGRLTVLRSSIRDNGEFDGPGIASSGTTLIFKSEINDNHGWDYAGGINVSGTALIYGSRVDGNTSGSGGGIFTTGGSVTLSNSTVINNKARWSGGGIFSDDGMTILHSTIAGNEANSGGGGILTYGGLIADSTVSGNHSTGTGGALRTHGELAIRNSTFSNNWSFECNADIWNSEDGILAITDSTLVGVPSNDCDATLGNAQGGAVTIQSTIVQRSQTFAACVGMITSLGHNIGNDDSCGLTSDGDISGGRIALAPLAKNGGSTRTHMLEPGSMAIDAGDQKTCGQHDQRGYGKPVDGNSDGTAICDIGAVEFGASPVENLPPVVVCSPVASDWQRPNATISCSATDPESDLNPAYPATFTLTTNIGSGSETANASTGSQAVCDNSGLCTLAGPFNAKKVDRAAPLVVASPTVTRNATSPDGAVVNYGRIAIDRGSGIATVQCQRASGSMFPVGTSTFACTATDRVGNASTQQLTVRVLGVDDQIDALRSAVSGMGLPAETANALDAALITARDADESISNQDTCSALSDFVDIARAERTAGHLTTEQLTLLRSNARRIMAVAGCAS